MFRKFDVLLEKNKEANQSVNDQAKSAAENVREDRTRHQVSIKLHCLLLPLKTADSLA